MTDLFTPDSSGVERAAHNGLVGGSNPSPVTTGLEKLSRDLEHYETPEWAAKAILRREVLTKVVIDPCCGTGVLTDAVREQGYTPIWIDIHDWGYFGTQVRDFLKVPKVEIPIWAGRCAVGFSVFMNAPFSKATDFVEKSFALGARKVVCFQRFAWWESAKRREFWEKYPPTKVYVCGDRAPSWRHDIPLEKRNSTSPTAHAWFVFEAGHKGGTLLDHIWKADAA